METQTQKKKCSQCQYDLPIYSFGLNCSSSDGYNYTCKTCRNTKRKYDYKKSSVDLNQLPQKFRNKEILKTINGDTKFNSKCGYEVIIKFFEEESQVRINKDDELVLGLDICGIDASYLGEVLEFHLKELGASLIHIHG